jgi:hypothetical protein
MAFNGAIPAQLVDGSIPITTTVEGPKTSLDVSIVNTAVAGVPSISNVPMTLADTEYSFAIPSGTKKLTFRTRTSGALKFCFTLGNSAITFLSVSPGSSYTLDGLNTSTSLTLYFQSPKALETLEILRWS